MSIFSHSLNKLSSHRLSVGASDWANIIHSRHLLLIMKAFHATNQQLKDAQYLVRMFAVKPDKKKKKVATKTRKDKLVREPWRFLMIRLFFPVRSLFQPLDSSVTCC